MARTEKRWLYLGMRETAEGKKGDVLVDVDAIENDGSELPDDLERMVFKRGRKPIAARMRVGSIGTIESDEGGSVWGQLEPTGDAWQNVADVRRWQASDLLCDVKFRRRAAEKKSATDLDDIIAELAEFMPRGVKRFPDRLAFGQMVVAKLHEAYNVKG